VEGGEGKSSCCLWLEERNPQHGRITCRRSQFNQLFGQPLVTDWKCINITSHGKQVGKFLRITTYVHVQHEF